MSTEQDEVPSSGRTNYAQVDLMKAVAIALVILDHSITHGLRSSLLPYFWELTSIPLFLVVMGFNAGTSFRSRETESPRGLYSKDYLRKKSDRYFRPFAVTYLLGLTLAAISALVQTQIVSSLDFLPFWGPGIWFVPVALTSVMVLPVVYRLFVWKPSAAVALCLLTDLLQHIVLYLLTNSVPAESLAADLVRFSFLTSVTIYLFPVALGFWFSRGYRLTERHNCYLYPVFILSFVYIALLTFTGFRVFFIPEVGFEYNLFVMPYSAFLFLLGMRLLPMESQNRHAKLLARVGKASYHILMVQTIYFSVLYAQFPFLPIQGVASDAASNIIFYLTNLLVCIIVGVFWSETSGKKGSRIPMLSK